MDFADILQKGMALRHEPQRLMRAKQQEELANVLSREKGLQAQAETPYSAQNAQSNAAIQQNTAQNAPRMSQAQYEHLLAQAERDKAMGALGGMQFSGGAGLVQGEQGIGRMHGFDSPLYKRAVKANDLLLNQRQTGISKLHNEIDNLKYENNNPNITSQKYAENEAKINQLENDAFNKQSDLDVRQKGLGAKLMEQTWEKFIKGPSMKALKRYTGAQGQFRYLKDLGAYNLFGTKSEDFNNLLEARGELYTLSDQYMKAFPGSTNYQRMQSVHEHMDPSGPMMPPDALERYIKSNWATIHPELKTYYSVLHGKNPLRGEKEEGRGAHNETIKTVNENAKKQNYEGKTRNLDLTTRKLS